MSKQNTPKYVQITENVISNIDKKLLKMLTESLVEDILCKSEDICSEYNMNDKNDVREAEKDISDMIINRLKDINQKSIIRQKKSSIKIDHDAPRKKSKNKKEPKKIDKVSEQQTKWFKPYQWIDKDGSHNHYEIGIFCLDDNNETSYVRVVNYQPYIYIELPNSYNWDDYNAQRRVFESICYSLKKFKHAPTEFVYEEKFRCYPYDPRTYPIMTLKFSQIDAMRHAVNLLRKHPVKLGQGLEIEVIVHEAQDLIPQLVKYLGNSNTKFADWFKCECIEVNIDELKESRCREYIVTDWTTVSPLSEEEYEKAPNVQPKVLCSDIETYSRDHKSSPKEINPEDVCYMIGNIFQNEHGMRKSICLVYDAKSEPCRPIEDRQREIVTDKVDKMKKKHLKDLSRKHEWCKKVKHDVNGTGTYDKMETEIIYFEDEEEMIMYYGELLLKYQPNVILGYNYIGYDWHYKHYRLSRTLNDWPDCSMIKGYDTRFVSFGWSSGSYGANQVRYLDLPGIVTIDSMYIVKRGFKKYPNYKLDTIAQAKLGVGKSGLDYITQWEYYASRDPKKIEEIVYYCQIDVLRTLQLFEHDQQWLECCEISNEMYVQPFDTFTRGQQVRCISMNYVEAMKMNVFFHKIEFPKEEMKIPGAHVFDPISGVYYFVPTFDFEGLYPSIIRLKNLCYFTYVHPEHGVEVEDDLCEIITQEYYRRISKDSRGRQEINVKAFITESTPHHDEYTKIIKTDRFVKSEVRRGIIPRVEDRLYDTRKLYKRRSADAFKRGDYQTGMLYFFKQNGVKLSMNSEYGVLTAQEGAKMPLPPAGRVITYLGRTNIKKACKFVVEGQNAAVIYGDTDSVKCFYYNRKLVNPQKFFDKTAEDMNVLYKKPMNMEHEGWAMIYVLLKKKKYAEIAGDNSDPLKAKRIMKECKEYLLNNPDYVFQAEDWIKKLGTLEMKGILPVRRDNCKIQRDMYRDILVLIALDAPLHYVRPIVEKYIINLMSTATSVEDLTIIKEYKGQYKSETSQMPVYAKHLASRGIKVTAGDRLDYVFAKVEDRKANQSQRMRDPSMLKQYDEEIDRFFYIENCLTRQHQELIQLSYQDDDISKNYVTIIKKIVENKIALTEEINTCGSLAREQGTRLVKLLEHTGFDYKKCYNIPIIDEED